MTSPVQQLGDKWVRSNSSLVLQVPSVALPGENNYLLNPTHPDLVKISYNHITTFNFDPRLS